MSNLHSISEGNLILPLQQYEKNAISFKMQISRITQLIIKKFLLTLVFFISHETAAQQTWCNTISVNPPTFSNPSVNESGPFVLRVYVHVMRKTDGTEGQTSEQVKEALSFLDEAFDEHNIFFSWDCTTDYIDDDELFFGSNPASVFNINNHSDGIDIYLGPENLFRIIPVEA